MTSPSPKIFLTAHGRAGATAAIPEPPSMSLARQLHSKLNETTGTLNDKVKALLQRQESEFLSAYKSHMFALQKELSVLRAKASDTSLSLERDERLKEVEKERDWYRGEALRLDSFSSSLRLDVKSLSAKLQHLQEENRWLESSLKSAKKMQGIKHGVISDFEDGEGVTSNSASTATGNITTLVLPSLTSSKKVGGGGGVAAASGLSSSSSTSTSALSARAPPPSSAAATAAVAAVSAKEVENYKAEIAQLHAQLESLRGSNTKLKASNIVLKSRRTDMEVALGICVEQTKKHVAARRIAEIEKSPLAAASAAALEHRHKKAAAATSGGGGAKTGLVESAISGGRDLELAMALARAKRVTPEDFSAEEREGLVKMLISRDDVLDRLIDVVFGVEGTQERDPIIFTDTSPSPPRSTAIAAVAASPSSSSSSSSLAVVLQKASPVPNAAAKSSALGIIAEKQTKLPLQARGAAMTPADETTRLVLSPRIDSKDSRTSKTAAANTSFSVDAPSSPTGTASSPTSPLFSSDSSQQNRQRRTSSLSLFRPLSSGSRHGAMDSDLSFAIIGDSAS